MIPQIANALSKGFTTKQVIDYILKQFPQHASKIKGAMAAGFTVDQIVNFLGGGRKALSEVSQPSTEHEKIRAGDIKRRENVDQGALAFGALGATSLAAPMAQAALQRALPTSLSKLAQQIPLLQQSNQQTLGSPPSQSPINPGSLQNNIPNQAQTGLQKTTSNLSQVPSQQPPANAVNTVIPSTLPPSDIINQPKLTENIKSPSDVLWNDLVAGTHKKVNPEIDGLMKIAQRMRTTGEIGSKEDFDKFYNLFEQKKSQGMSLPKALKEASSEFDKSKTQQPTISKNETVASPQGIGEVKEVRGDKALVEVDGKLHKVAVDELENEPEEIKELDLSESVEDYLSRIPEGQKSSVIDVSLFDPTTNELQIRFPNGDQWIYGPIPEEVFDKINSMTGIPITSGESKLRGTIWEMGVANSAGADFYKLIKKFVKEGKVKERKLKTGIDLFRGFTRVKKRK